MNNMKEYYREYELLIDLPTGEKKGDHFFFHVSNDDDKKTWYQVGEKLKYTKEVKWCPDFKSKGSKLNISNMTPDFFTPVGKPKLLYPKFPNKINIKEFYHLVGESRLINSVDEVRAINQVFYSDEYYDACYDILKKMYNEKFFKEE